MTAPSRRAANRNAQTARILDAALRVFSRVGFAGASMEAIAAEAGITKPTLYNYFTGKEALFVAMMSARRDNMLAPLARPGEGDTMASQLLGFARQYARVVMDPDMLALTRLAIAESGRNAEFGKSFLSAGPDRLLSGLMSYLEDQRTAGLLSFEDAELAAQDLWGLILSAPRSRALHDPSWQPAAGDLSRFLMNGLAVFLRAYATDPKTACADLHEAASGNG